MASFVLFQESFDGGGVRRVFRKWMKERYHVRGDEQSNECAMSVCDGDGDDGMSEYMGRLQIYLSFTLFNIPVRQRVWRG